jgi:hypothetical protein
VDSRIATGQADPKRGDEITRWANERLLPALRTLLRFKGYHGGADARSRRIVTVATWETREHADRMGQGLAEVVSDLAALGVTRDPSQTYQQTISA